MIRGRGIVTKGAALLCAALLASCAAAKTPGESLGGSYGDGTGKPTLSSKKPKPNGGGKNQGSSQGLPASNNAPKQKGTISVTVRAPNGDPLAGVTVAFKGPQDGKIVTDQAGVAEWDVKPGAYALDTEPCGTDVHVTLGGGADLTVAPGTRTTGDVTVGGWEPRFQPIIKVQAPTPPPWRIGKAFKLRTAVGDKCFNSKPVSSSVSVEPWSYETSAPLQLAKTPSMQTDAKGWLVASFACNGVGDGDIALRDPRNGTRYVPVLGAVTRPQGSSYCVN
jgi:hypothetical protein